MSELWEHSRCLNVCVFRVPRAVETKIHFNGNSWQFSKFDENYNPQFQTQEIRKLYKDTS